MSIQFKQVSYIYQPKSPYEHRALENVNTVFKDGQYYAIVGRTGSGKSTLMQHINALLKPSSGEVIVNDQHVGNKTKDKYLHTVRKSVGLVFQFPEAQLFEDTIERELLFGPRNFNMAEEQVLTRAHQLLRDFGFGENVMQLSPFQLSGGQMRKIAIISILAMDPDIIMLDEPTAGLDPESKKQVMAIIKRLQVEEGKTIILITHDMNDVAQYADEVKVMKNGTVVETLSPRQLFSDIQLVNELHLELPHIVQLQNDLEAKYQTRFNYQAMTEEEFADLYQRWRSDER
ncbi:energy-coupling factor transporter ATPase [Staphylococcus sp. SQ8-PEA]|uniref:Energy-coupling factor transporter ATP-binding protein EcfA2 n=1 Tax=Staphylococcus marylandisciuri TaxID=2981529 RepID=A0ABT2QMD0_9STAP|nr:energy-coupling factor transporter ATPase [Staphylococcus marylandisciuri]MCU5745131.1 energy-coupling factor transporter ATPase [Staphylococcus marylandisciuri]